MAGDLNFKIGADLAEVKAALADLKRTLAGAGGGAERGFKPLNDELDKTAAKSRQAASEAERAGREAERAAQRAAAAQERATRAQERDAQRAARAQQRANEDQERADRRTAARAAANQQREAQSATRQAVQQQRQLAPQLTDIGVGLATGQSPLMVLLQQGGQLKDLFGGIVPAAKAVGGAVLGLINPVTVLGGAIGVVALGYIKGADEGARFRRIVIETGGVSGQTAGQMDALAASLGNLAGSTRASAADTIAQVASAGKFADEQIGIVARAAEQLRNSAGRDVGTTVGEFAKLADDPVKAVDELNRRYGFLTGSIAAQIRTLQEQGRTQEASTLAMRAYAAAVDERAPKIRENLGLIERAWRAITEGARSAGSALLNIGRDADPQKQFDDLVKRRQQLQARLDGIGRNDGRRRATDERELADITEQIRRQQDARVAAEQQATRNAAQARAVSAQRQFTDEARQFESSTDRLTRERTRVVEESARALGDAQTAADAKAAADIEQARDQRLAGLAREAAKQPLQVAQANATIVKDATERSIEELQRLYDRGLVSASSFFAKRRDLQLQALDADIAAQRAELATTQESGEISRIAAQIKTLERRKADVRRDAIRDEARATQVLQEQLLEVEVGLQKDALDRALGLLEANFDRAEVATADYFAARQALQLAAIDNDLALVRKRLQSQEIGPADRARLLADEQRLEGQRNDIKLRAIRDGDAAARDLRRTLDQARAQELEGRGQTAEAARIRLEAQFEDLLKRLERDGNEAGVRLIRGLINTGAASAQFQQLQTEFDRVLNGLQARLATIQANRDSGAITGEQSAQQQAEARAQASADLAVLIQRMEELARVTGDPTIVQGAEAARQAFQRLGAESITGLDAAIVGLRRSLDQLQQGFAQAATNAGVDAIANFFVSLGDRTTSAKEKLRDFVASFAQSMLQIAARALATFAVLQLLDAVYPGLGRATAATVGVGASVQHSGGMAGSGPKRDVPAWLFAGAPRYHNGTGVLGLKPDEIPAILQTGERVQSRAEVAASRSGGQGGGVRIVNAVDPGVIHDAMSSAAGERVILNVIERNAGTVRQRLAG